MAEELQHVQTTAGVQAARRKPANAAQSEPVPGLGDPARSDARPVAAGSTAWRQRVTRRAQVDPRSLLAHPDNYKAHPDQQKQAISSAIDEIGFLGAILVSERSGRILDGHMRVAEAIRTGQPVLPVDYVDAVDDEEELRILGTFDPIGALAVQDQAKLAALADRSKLSSDPLIRMLGGLSRKPAPPDDDEPGGRVVGRAFGPQGGPSKGGKLGQLAEVIYPIVIECATEADQLDLVNRLAAQELAVYTLTPSPSAIGEFRGS